MRSYFHILVLELLFVSHCVQLSEKGRAVELEVFEMLWS